MKEKLFNIFLSDYNVDNWHPCDVEKLHEYIEYCFFNNVTEEEMIKLVELSSLPRHAKNNVIECCKKVYGYLLSKKNKKVAR